MHSVSKHKTFLLLISLYVVYICF